MEKVWITTVPLIAAQLLEIYVWCQEHQIPLLIPSNLGPWSTKRAIASIRKPGGILAPNFPFKTEFAVRKTDLVEFRLRWAAEVEINRGEHITTKIREFNAHHAMLNQGKTNVR